MAWRVGVMEPSLAILKAKLSSAPTQKQHPSSCSATVTLQPPCTATLQFSLCVKKLEFFAPTQRGKEQEPTSHA